MLTSSSRVLLALIALLLLNLIDPSVAQAPQPRSIPRTPRNEQFFALTQSIFIAGKLTVSSCANQRLAVQACIRTCNSPGPKERDGCCCVIENTNDEPQFYVGVRGGCRYSQRVLNFTESFIYESTPIDSDALYFDETTCAFTEENANNDRCTCTLQWEASFEKLNVMSPSPTPTSSPSPKLSPSMSIPPIRTAEPTIEVTPTMQPTPDPATAPTIVTPPIGDQTQSPIVSVEPTPLPMDEAQVSPSNDDELDPSVSVDEDDDSVCVDQKYLLDRGYSAHHFVHPAGIVSPVLCPQHSQLPCASANHKVRYNGVDMSYSQLCQHDAMACSRDEMIVNSVYSHLWNEVPHGQVVLTMFDTRYAETPQKGLHSIMHAFRTVRNSLV